MRILLFAVLVQLIAAAPSPSGHTSSGFPIDTNKPYVYIEFDHVAPRKPVRDGESAIGIWLNLVNNCRTPIRVIANEFGTRDPGVALHYDVISATSSSPRLLGGDQPEKITPKADKAIPRGYSFGVGSPIIISPGKKLLFSVAADQLSPSWYIEVSFELVLSESPTLRQPTSLVDFTWGGVPTKVRKQLIDTQE
jgi:hypothetical protein